MVVLRGRVKGGLVSQSCGKGRMNDGMLFEIFES
jgi:hypothetical protein